KDEGEEGVGNIGDRHQEFAGAVGSQIFRSRIRNVAQGFDGTHDLATRGGGYHLWTTQHAGYGCGGNSGALCHFVNVGRGTVRHRHAMIAGKSRTVSAAIVYIAKSFCVVCDGLPSARLRDVFSCLAGSGLLKSATDYISIEYNRSRITVDPNRKKDE